MRRIVGVSHTSDAKCKMYARVYICQHIVLCDHVQLMPTLCDGSHVWIADHAESHSLDCVGCVGWGLVCLQPRLVIDVDCAS